MSVPSPITQLQQRLRTNAAGPLWTLYDITNARVELSAVTVANWANKIAWFLEEEDIAPGQQVHLDLANTRPLHWATLAWVLGCWQAGVTPSTVSGDLCVATAERAELVEATVVASMHPLGLRVAGLAPGLTDFAEVLVQPDAHKAEPLTATSMLWQGETTAISFGDLHDLSGTPERRVVTTTDPWQAVCDAILRPLATGGSAVLIEAGDLDAIRASENAV
ncbi:MAG: TIGR03089 family protein [Propionibacteriaceae bacterium]